MKKNKKVYLIASIVAALIILLSVVSYALWQDTLHQTNSNVVGTACLDVEIIEEGNDDISLLGAWPMTDLEGEATTPYTFTVKNKCNEAVNYQVALESIESTDPNASYLSYDYVRVRLDHINTKYYSSLATLPNDDDPSLDYTIRDTKAISTFTVDANDSNNHELRIWLDEDTPLINQDNSKNTEKTFLSKIKIIAGQGMAGDQAESCYAINNKGFITKYNSVCGSNVVIPDEVDGITVKGIASRAFFSSPYVNGLTQFFGEYTVDDADFVVVLSDDFGNAMMSESAEAIASIGLDDIWIAKLKNTTGIDDAIYHALTEGEVSEMAQVLIANGYTTEQILGTVCTYGTAGCQSGALDAYNMVVDNSGTYTSAMIGVHYSPDMTSTMMGDSAEEEVFVATSVDFSQATHLEEIKAGAFSEYHSSTLSLPNSVKIIGDRAFEDYEGDELVLPASLEVVGEYAFEDFYQTLTFNNNLKTIGAHAFEEYQGSGTSLSLPNAETIGEQAFRSFAGDSITLGNNLVSIGTSAFANYQGSTLALNDSLKTIGDNAFVRFNGTLTMNNAVESIGESAFSSYVGTGASLVLPSTLKYIGPSAFSNYSGTSLTLPPRMDRIGASAFQRYSGSNQPLVIPEGIVDLEDSVFEWYAGGINSITFPSTLKTIGRLSLSNYMNNNNHTYAQTDLVPGVNLVIPEGVTSLGSGAFNQFNGETITFPSTLQTIGDNAFSIWYGVDLTIPNNVTEIGYAAFNNFNGTLSIGNKIEKIGTSAFYSYVGTGTSLSLPAIKTIGDYAFNNFKGSSVTFGNSLESIGQNAFVKFVGTGSNLVVPASGEIGTGAFKIFNGASLSVSGTSIGNQAFYTYNGPSLTLSGNLTTIAEQAFYYFNDTSYDPIEIPASVTSIGSKAFYNFGNSSFNRRIIVHSQSLVDSRADWANTNAYVVLAS